MKTTLYCRELRAVYGPSLAMTPPRNRVMGAQDAFAVIAPMLESAAEEHAVMLLLDARHHVIAISQISSGGVSGTVVDPKVVFRAALLANASGVIFAHNHPSGDVAPSPDDLALTRRLGEAGELIGCQLLDSVVIGDGRYYSCRDNGVLR
jgi:DNA repair protein RadC